MSPSHQIQNQKLQPQRNKVHIGNLAQNVTSEELREFFKECGKMDDVFVIQKENFAFAFIQFEKQEGLHKAVEMSGTEFKGKSIKCSEAYPPEKKELKCYNCGRKGHMVRDCRKPFVDKNGQKRDKSSDARPEDKNKKDKLKKRQASPSNEKKHRRRRHRRSPSSSSSDESSSSSSSEEYPRKMHNRKKHRRRSYSRSSSSSSKNVKKVKGKTEKKEKYRRDRKER